MSLLSDVSRHKVSDNFPSLRPLRNGSKATNICNKLARNFQTICARGCNPLMKMTYIHFNVSNVNGGKKGTSLGTRATRHVYRSIRYEIYSI